MKRLSELKNGDVAIIVKLHSTGEYTQRLGEMGFIRGRRVVVIKNAPLRDPIEYELMGSSVSLRRSEAYDIEVVLDGEVTTELVLDDLVFAAQVSCDNCAAPERGNRTINVALIGNPNCGKTTIFNRLSGRDEHVGNYSGVTVEMKQAEIEHGGYTIRVTDLPGTYSLSSYSPEERIVREELMGDRYDFVINVVDVTLLERNLYLTTQLMDMAKHIVVALNMYDELDKLGNTFDHEQMGRMLDIPFIPTVGRTGVGLAEVLDMVVAKYEGDLPHTHVESNLGMFVEDCLDDVAEVLSVSDVPELPRRYLAALLVSGDEEIVQRVGDDARQMAERMRHEIEHEYNESISQVMSDSRYGYIAGALKETLSVNSERFQTSQRIDNVLTHKVWGFPIFMFLVWFMFYTTFTLGGYPQEWIDCGISWLSDVVSGLLGGEGALHDLLIDGVIGGVGSVIIFLPNILLLFLFISILEDTGYMARAAFIMDKLMHKIGLHGKSFVPMIMGFGCNVPAIMACRIIENRRNRLLTMLIVPFMSCSARLPVYILLVGAFFPSHASLVLFGLYVFGVVLAVLSSLLLQRFIMVESDQPFVMELPPYRMPLVSNTLKHMWNKAGQYLRKMGGIILVGAMIIWALGYYPTREDSYLERIGHVIEPTISPLGFDWKVGVSLVSGIAAKEIVVSTMGVLYNVEVDDDDTHVLAEQMKLDRYQSGAHEGELIFTLPVVLAFLAFVLIYFPCLAVVAAIKRESGSWGWAIFSVVYTTGLAWVVSFVIYNVGRMLV
ncbi:MAG: ferrous iron transport protein B [Rikenellaceae bacterium]